MSNVLSESVVESFLAPGCDGGDDVNGLAIVPPSETKTVVIPSPPTTQIVPINPRVCVFYVSEELISEGSKKAESLIAIAEENKLVILSIGKQNDDGAYSVLQWALSKAHNLNIKKDVFAVVCDEKNADVKEAIEEMLDGEDLQVEEISF